MTATFWPAGVEPVSGLARGYALAGGSTHDVTYSLHPSVAGAAGALISNLHDMKIWARAVARGDLLSEEMQKKRLEWITPGSSDQLKVGLGIIYDHGLIGFHGAFGGHQASVMYLPERDAVIVVFTNMMGGDKGSSALLRGIADALYSDRLAR